MRFGKYGNTPVDPNLGRKLAVGEFLLPFLFDQPDMVSAAIAVAAAGTKDFFGFLAKSRTIVGVAPLPSLHDSLPLTLCLSVSLFASSSSWSSSCTLEVADRCVAQAVVHALLLSADAADRDDLARSLVIVACAYGREKELMYALCAMEVQVAESVGTLFRGE